MQLGDFNYKEILETVHFIRIQEREKPSILMMKTNNCNKSLGHMLPWYRALQAIKVHGYGKGENTHTTKSKYN